jgi:hypothetical protein
MTTAVILKYPSDGYFDIKCQVNAYTRWLTINQITHTFIATTALIDVPTAILLDSTDAVAFKLRFGL